MLYLEELHARRALNTRLRKDGPGPICNPKLDVKDHGDFHSRNEDFPSGLSHQLARTMSKEEIRASLRKLLEDAKNYL